MSRDVIGDFLTIIRNGVMASKPFVTAPHSQMKEAVANILKDEGFIKDVQVEDIGSNKKKIKIYLKYTHGEAVIHSLVRLSTPGRRAYKKVATIKPVIGNLGVSILSTSKGIMTNKQACALGVGGEILCSVW